MLSGGEQTKGLALRLVFILLGLTTMLYAPMPSCASATTTIDAEERGDILVMDVGGSHTPASSKSRTWITDKLNTMDVAALSVGDMLRRFSGSRGPIPWLEPSVISHRLLEDLDALKSPNLSYYTLTRLAQVEIQWVNSVCQHLEFDSHHKILKLFRFPSFCGMVCAAEIISETTFFDRLFQNYFSDITDREVLGGGSDNKPESFFKEILLTYRLIFGQDKDSYTAFQKDNKARVTFPENDGSHDPLLWTLCSQNWTTQQVFVDIDSPSVRTVYSAKGDFPFLGERLKILQEFSLTQTPNDWTTLWRDRRDISRFWTLWAVIILGGATLVLAIFGLGLQVAQVVAGFPH